MKKQSYKQDNNLSDLNLDTNDNIDLKYTYNSEIFKLESQKEVTNFLIESLENKDYDFIPLNIGIDNFELNNMISDYNKIVTERNKYLIKRVE